MKSYDLHPLTDLEPTLGILLSTLDDVTSEWRGELGDVSEETIVWQAYPGGHSIGGLMLHIADVEAYWIEQVAAGRELPQEFLAEVLSAETQQYEMQWPTPPRKPLASFYALQDRVREQTRETLRALADPNLVIRQERRDREFTLRYILNHVVSHEAYHGGQAALLSILRTQSTAGSDQT